MDYRHRVYFLVNLNQNYKRQGWWSTGWDSYGIRYDSNLKELKQSVRSLKIRPCNYFERSPFDYYQFKVSCLYKERNILMDTLDRLPDVNYMEVVEL